MNRKMFILLIVSLFFISISTSVLGATVSYWEFEQNLTDSVGSNDGTRYNFVNGYVNGIVGYGLEFNQDDFQYVSFGNDSSLNFGSKNFTVETWVNITDGTWIEGYIISKIDFGTNPAYNGWYIKYNGNQKFEIYLSGGSFPSVNYETNSTYDEYLWYNLTLQRIDDNFLLYVNDILEINETESIGDIDNIADVLIGCRYYGEEYREFLKGVVDNAKIIYDYIPSTTTTTIIPTTTTTIPSTTTTILSGEGILGRTLSDIGEGTGNFLNAIKEPATKMVMSVGMIGVILFIFYAIASGIQIAIRGKR